MTYNNITIIGGGISGIISAIKLAENKMNKITIFEKRDTILRGPPYCHLHAGGMLYPEISLKDAQILQNDCLDFVLKFKNCIDYRPTIIAYKADSKYDTNKLIFKCNVLKLNYILQSQKNPDYKNLLGDISQYYSIYTRDDVLNILNSPLSKGNFHDKYVYNFCKLLCNIDSIKYPFVSICEWGINQEMVEHQLETELQNFTNITIIKNTDVNIEELKNSNIIINATGCNLYNETNLYEYKSSWVIKCPLSLNNFQEIAIIGERDTKNGMIQITPIENKNLFQIHFMSSTSSIIETYNKKHIVKQINQDEQIKRTQIAIREICNYFPVFGLSKFSKACTGVQRILYNTKNKRISKLEFINNTIDIVTMKACSIVTLCNKLKEIV